MAAEEDLINLKSNLQKYRSLIIPLNKILEWEQNFYPGVVIGVITFVFALVWYLEPSILTTVCLIGIILSAADFALPTLISHLFSSEEWSAVQEAQYDAICQRLVHAKQHVVDLKNWLTDLKANKPKIYLVIMMAVFASTAWLGSLIDNLFLTYLIVVGLTMIPGLRKHGILQQGTDKIKDLIANARSSKPKTS